ncbi:hypothetical protein D3C79_418970 [compost metagenome]
MGRCRVVAFTQVAGAGGGYRIGCGIHVRGTEDGHDEQVHTEEHLAPWQRQQQVGHGRFAALFGEHLRYIHRTGDELVHAVAFQRAEEEPATEAATQQQGQHHFLDLPAARNAGHEHGHAWSVRHPPQPVEHRPVTGEGTVAGRVGEQAHVHVVLDHQANRVGGVVDGELGRADQQDHRGEHQRADAHHLAQALQAAIDADVGTEREHHCHATDHQQLHGEGVRGAGQVVQAAGEGGGGEGQRHGQRAHHGQQEDQVDATAYRPGSLEAGHRFDDRGQVQAALLAHVEVIGHGQRGQGIDRPGADAPVEERVADAVLECLGGGGGDVQARGLVVVGPFHHAPVQGRRAHAGADEHEHPGGGSVFGLAAAQADVAVLAEGQVQHGQGTAEHQHLHAGTEGAGGQFEQLVGGAFRLGGEGCKADHGEQHGNQAHGNQEHINLFILVRHHRLLGRWRTCFTRQASGVLQYHSFLGR